MIGTSFFRSNDQKCPRCGSFGVTDEDMDDMHVQTNVCPSCSTRFNKYVILQEGQDIEFQNH